MDPADPANTEREPCAPNPGPSTPAETPGTGAPQDEKRPSGAANPPSHDEAFESAVKCFDYLNKLFKKFCGPSNLVGRRGFADEYSEVGHQISLNSVLFQDVIDLLHAERAGPAALRTMLNESRARIIRALGGTLPSLQEGQGSSPSGMLLPPIPCLASPQEGRPFKSGSTQPSDASSRRQGASAEEALLWDAFSATKGFGRRSRSLPRQHSWETLLRSGSPLDPFRSTHWGKDAAQKLPRERRQAYSELANLVRKSLSSLQGDIPKVAFSALEKRDGSDPSVFADGRRIASWLKQEHLAVYNRLSLSARVLFDSPEPDNPEPSDAEGEEDSPAPTNRPPKEERKGAKEAKADEIRYMGSLGSEGLEMVDDDDEDIEEDSFVVEFTPSPEQQQ